MAIVKEVNFLMVVDYKKILKPGTVIKPDFYLIPDQEGKNTYRGHLNVAVLDDRNLGFTGDLNETVDFSDPEKNGYFFIFKGITYFTKTSVFTLAYEANIK